MASRVPGDARWVVEGVVAQLSKIAGDADRASRQEPFRDANAKWAAELGAMDHEEDDAGTTCHGPGLMAPAPMMTTMAAPTMTAMPTSAAPVMGAMPAMVAPAMTTMAAPTMAAMPTMTTMAATTVTAMFYGAGHGGGSFVAAPMTAPAMTTMAAPTMSAVPAMTTMAAPAVSAMPSMPSDGAGYGGGSFVGVPMAAPAMTTMAAPTIAVMPAMTAMAAPAYGGGSFVAAPPIPAYEAAMPPTGPPQRLTAGMPDPASIERQKLQYSRAIDLGLQKEAQQVRSKQEKAQSYLTIDQYATYGNMYVDDLTLAEIAYLQEASAQHRQILEQQASALALEYNQRKAQEDMMMRQYRIQRRYYENSQRLQGMQSEVRG